MTNITSSNNHMTPIDDVSLIYGEGYILHNGDRKPDAVKFCFGEGRDRLHVSIEPRLDQSYLKGDLILECGGRRFALEYFGAGGIFRYRVLSSGE